MFFLFYRVTSTTDSILKLVHLYVTRIRNQYPTGKESQTTLMMPFNTQMVILTFSKMVDIGDSMIEDLA